VRLLGLGVRLAEAQSLEQLGQLSLFGDEALTALHLLSD
jgi:hypothetical protein